MVLRLRFLVAGLMLGCAPLPAMAGLIGIWCMSEDEPALYFEATNLGLGENRICLWTQVPGEARHEDRVTCRQFHVDDAGQAVVIGETVYDFVAQLIAPDRMTASFDDGTGPVSYDYRRCDG